MKTNMINTNLIKLKEFVFKEEKEKEEDDLLYIEILDPIGEKELAHRFLTKDQEIAMIGICDQYMMLDAKNISEICGRITLKCTRKTIDSFLVKKYVLPEIETEHK